MQPVFRKVPEILAPAGSFDALVAAVRCGADAVYLGTKSFSARAGAQNFDGEELRRAVAYCHERSVRVHLAVNTALYDDELPAAAALIEQAATLGVDALIVADLGVLSLARRVCPELALHASTQMGIAGPDAARMAQQLGCSRVVLARELSRAEIAAVAAVEGIETEVFVHGAMCMCVSGQCYLSAVLGARSGNRGRCAQPCRLPFRLGTGGTEHALSLRDLSLQNELPALCEMGVDSFKIEGRMKRPEYVAAAVSLIYATLHGQNCAEIAELAREVFSRSGFSNGFFNGKIDARLFGFRTRQDVESAQKALPRLHELYRRERSSVPIDMTLSAAGDVASLCVTDLQGHRGISEGPATPGGTADASAVRRQLARLGETPYYLRQLKLPAVLPALSCAQLNALRRDAVRQLSAQRQQPVGLRTNSVRPLRAQKRKTRPQILAARFETLQQAAACRNLCDDFWLPAQAVIRAEELPVAPEKVCAVLPRSGFAGDSFCKQLLDGLEKKGIRRVCVQHIGQLPQCLERGLELCWGPFLNLFNRETLAALEQCGVRAAVASFEMPAHKIACLETSMSLGLLVYGYLPLMITRACPVRARYGCDKCGGRGGFLTDRQGKQFRLVCRGGVSELYNTVPLVAPVEQEAFSTADFWLSFFKTESSQQCREILLRLRSKKDALSTPPFTRGLYQKGVF